MTVAGTALIAALGTLVAVAAVGFVIAFARGWNPARRGAGKGRRPGRLERLTEQLPENWQRRYKPLLVAALVAGLAVWVITGWPIQGVITAACLAGLPFVLHPGGSPKLRIEALEGVAEWLHQLAGVHVAGLSLEQTIRSSAPNAPAPVRQQVQQLAMRLDHGWPAEDAYRALADDLQDGTVDHVVLLLQTHARDRGQGLSRALEALSESLSDQVADARDIEADRAKVRTAARWISLFVLGAVTLSMLNRAYTAPYGSPQGQLLLMVLGGLFALLLVRMHRMSKTEPEPRLLAPAGSEAEELSGEQQEKEQVTR